VRKGVPQSPFLFNLAVDGLAIMLERAKVAGLINGLVPDLIEGDRHICSMLMILLSFWKQMRNMWQI
jgi:hypothetical protein